MLLPSRALWLEHAATLVIADVHLGKEASFRAGGVPVPDGGGRADLERVSGQITECAATRLVILGDLLHAKAGRTRAILDELHAWRARHPTLEVLLVRGNHDARAGDPPEELGMTVVDEPHVDAATGCVLAHYPSAARGVAAQDQLRLALAGHLHPCVSMRPLRGGGGAGGASGMRADCFWLKRTADGVRTLVLPAFGTFTGSTVVTPCSGDRVFAVGPGEVVEVRCAESSFSRW